MNRIARIVGRPINDFSTSIRHHFNNATCRAVLLAQSIGEIEIAAQCAYYHTNANTESYDCDLWQYFTRMFHRPIPCCHLIHAGLARLSMPDPPVFLQGPDPVSFSIDVEKVQWRAEEPSAEQRDSLVAMTAHNIK
jgi:hypothetical protein